jgi:membrane-associated protease RseP (regulator of RpoE activity)
MTTRSHRQPAPNPRWAGALSTLATFALALGLPALASTGAAAEGASPLEKPDPRALLARAKEAAGGAAWDRVRSLHSELAVSAGGLEGTARVWEDLATGRSASSFEIGPVSGAAGFDGESVWSKDGSGQVHVDDSQEGRETAANEAYLRCLGHFYPERWPAEVAYDRQEAAGERLFHVLRVHPKGGRAFELWLDASTLLVDRTVDHAALETRTTLFSDYREVEGLQIAFAQRSTNGEERYDQTTRLERVEVNPEIAEGAFAVPASTVTDFEIAGGAAAATFPFELSNNHIYAQVRFNGGDPQRVLVDTGGANVLTPAAAKGLGLEVQGRFEGRGAGKESADVGLAKVAELRLGDAVLRDQLFYVVPLANMEQVEGVDFAGLVGFEVFKRFVVRIDYAGRRLSLIRPEEFDPAGAGTAIPFTFEERTPQVEGEVDGVAGFFTLDTGSRSSLTLHAPFVAEHALVEKYGARFDALTGWGVGGGVRSYPVRARLLKLGGLAIPLAAADLFTGGEGAFANRYLAGNVGGGVLKRFTVTFDYGRKRLYLDPNGAPPEGYDRSGMWLNRDGDALRVEDVVAGSPAAAAGLAVGDRITAVDGRGAGDLSLPAVRQRFRSEPPGTAVHLTVEGAGGASREVTLTLRDLI